MAVILVGVRLLLAAAVVCSLAGVWPVAVGAEGVQLRQDDINRWSGLLGMLIAGAAAPAAMGAIAPKWVLANPLALGFAAVPLVVLLLVQLSDFTGTAMQVWALIGALCTAVALVMLPAVGLLARRGANRA